MTLAAKIFVAILVIGVGASLCAWAELADISKRLAMLTALFCGIVLTIAGLFIGYQS